jgi:hypothetical protein
MNAALFAPLISLAPLAMAQADDELTGRELLVFGITRWSECQSCKIGEKACQWGAIRLRSAP